MPTVQLASSHFPVRNKELTQVFRYQPLDYSGDESEVGDRPKVFQMYVGMYTCKERNYDGANVKHLALHGKYGC